MRGLTNISIGGSFADVLKGKSKEELKKIFGEKVPDNFQELLASSDKIEVKPPEEIENEGSGKGRSAWEESRLGRTPLPLK